MIHAERIRKAWLRSLFIYFLTTLGMIFVGFSFYSYNGYKEAADVVFTLGIAQVIGMSIQAAVWYSYVYEKYGTKFVGFFLYGSLIRTAFEFLKNFFEVSPLLDLSKVEAYYFLIPFLLEVCIYIYFWVHCKRLYNLNKEIKKSKVMAEVL